MRKMMVLSLSAMILAVGGGLLAAARGQTSGNRVGNPDQGRHVVEAKCAACHGGDGNAADPKLPKLSGEDPAYLYRQLWAFRTGARMSEVMARIVADLSEADMADAASFLGQ